MLFFVTVLALAAGVARADNGLLYVDAGISRDKLSNIAPNGGFADIDSTSWKLAAGVKPVGFFAIEADYLSLGSQTSNFVGGGSAHSDGKAFAGYAVGFLPLPVPFVDVFGKAGLARWSLSGSNSAGALFSFSNHGTEFAWGAGVGAHVGNVGGRLEYERFSIPNTDGARVYSLEVTFNIM
jgi:hypothetical protein